MSMISLVNMLSAGSSSVEYHGGIMEVQISSYTFFCGGEEKKHVFKDRRWPSESAQLTPMKLLNHTSIISKLEVKTNNQDYIEI